MKILVTGVGGPAGRRVSELLLAEGHQVSGADMQEAAFAGLDDFYKAPPAQADGYLPWLAMVAEDFDLVIPTVQEELPIVAAEKVVFPCRFLVGSREAVVTAQDKYRTVQALTSAGVPVPRSALPSMLTSAEDVSARLGWPCLSKPRSSRGGRNVTVYDGRDDYPLLAALNDTYIVQEFAPGTEYTVNLFVEDDQETVVVLEKTALREGRTGNALAVRRVLSADISETAVQAARAIGLTGPMDMDIRRRADGTPLVLEINARFGANIAHAPEILKAALQSERAQSC